MDHRAARNRPAESVTKDASGSVSTAQIAPLIQARCAGCHARAPTQPGFAAPPAGLVLESPTAIERHAARVFAAAVVTKTMPIGNLTGMTDQERERVAAWYHGLGKSAQSPAKVTP